MSDNIFWLLITSNAALVALVGKMFLEWLGSKKKGNGSSLEKCIIELKNTISVQNERLKYLENIKEENILKMQMLQQLLDINKETKDLVKLFTTTLIKSRIKREVNND